MNLENAVGISTWFQQVKHIASFVVVLMSMFTTHCVVADARDGLRHWWKVKDFNSDGFLQANEVYDVMTISSATPLVGATLYQSTDSEAGAKPVCITNDVYMATLRKNVADDALHFYNPTNYDANGKLQINYQALQLPVAASIGCTAATVVVRMKWDGARFKSSGGTGNYNYALTIYSNNYNPSSGAGWRVGLRCYSSDTGNQFHPFLDYGNQEFGFHYGSYPDTTVGKRFIISKDVWYDIAYTFRVETNGDGDRYVQVAALYRKGNPSEAANKVHSYQIRDAKKYTSSWKQYDAAVFAPCIGFHKASQAAPGWTTFGNATSDDTFTGSIHEIKVFDRYMTEEEMLQCMGGVDPLFTIGSTNKSADEFSDTDVAEVFDPSTMDWSRMRKTLNSSHPSASIRCSMNSYDLALPRLVEIKLLKNTVFSNDSINLNLNGSSVGNLSIPADGVVRFFLKPMRLSRLPQDPETGLYPAVLTICRKGSMIGDIQFDSVSVDGSWQLGVNDSSSSEFSSGDQNYHAYTYFIGQNDLSKLRVSTLGQGSYRDLDIHFCVGKWLADNCDYKLTLKSAGYQQSQLGLYVNDMDIVHDTIAIDDISGGKTFTFPAGTLMNGGNHVRISNQGESWVNLDYLRLEPVIPKGFKNTDKTSLILW